MKILIIALSLLVTASCYADGNLYRYTDKVTGDERGVSYSDQPIVNPQWNSEIITEKDKKKYIDKQNQQTEKINSDAAKKADRKKKKASNKLKQLGLDKDEVNAILGDAYGD